jgi:ABC-2 type transport system ATP-binding protein
METTALVEVQNLYKRYTPNGLYAVADVSFEIHAGELFSLLGPNGAGKTTAISVISTLLEPTSGVVRVAGQDVQRDPMAVRNVIGVAPQELALYDDLTAHENLRFWGEMRGLHGAELAREIDEKLGLIELADRAKERVSTFSGGMKRRLNLAVGLLGRPKLLMLDEPTVAIDPQSRRYILDWVKKLREQGVTILYTTHYMEEAQELSDRIGIIDRGKLIALGTLDELIQLVGQHETLRLQLIQEEGGAELAAALQSLAGVVAASATDGEVLINVTSAEATLAAVIGTATGLGLSVRTIDIREPNLEAVFLRLTGRALRD